MSLITQTRERGKKKSEKAKGKEANEVKRTKVAHIGTNSDLNIRNLISSTSRIIAHRW